jgi:YHS domain-containing protein
MEIYGYREVNQVIGIKCDTCGKNTQENSYVPIHIEFSYGHDLDGATYDFCSYECILKFITEELKKEKKC